MRITVRTTAVLGKYLPAGSNGTKAELEVDAEATPFDVMKQLGFPEERTYLVVLNGENVPKSRRRSMQLSEHDELAILPPLKGG